ncbi:bifunctional helix-turn-helix transcriptional regulator/GNAT family N-acetyltransferase [Mucilaginibacter sp. KACC 22063]|uniref:bifunctional helix-turn-helix transcriptional regulator/GNAT family N-acetyltransferase n=1 Tax=Mucilaginibacter sp. KACC 22063 TaxID=3025666 RepID=UPI0023669949|nr:GNAT family N-acetyltransferase [Mucilaginibacter sp. KACC 22063]WDF55052.1 GNAT family N-acetyltransferase [Mucilaginibacter sp. KACC 22063]
MEFYDKTGKMAIGSRLRRLSEKITEQAGQVYGFYDIDLQPKWFPVFYALSTGEQKTITQIAQEIGHSHPSVSTIIKEMMRKGIAEEAKHTGDARRNYVQLTESGLAINDRIQHQYTDVNAAIEKALSETNNNLWKAIEEWEYLLEQKSLDKRVAEEKKMRESKEVEIVAYRPEFKSAFREINEEWISTWFKMEEADYRSLDHPQEYIIDKGGYVLIALYNGEPVGTCALIKMDEHKFEMAKMAVSPKAKGKGIGELLGKAAIAKAKSAGANKLYLESNTVLKPALSLYQKLGFKKITGVPSPYERCNIQMELDI